MATRLNVLRLLVTLLVVLTTMVGYSQDSYRDALKDYLLLSAEQSGMTTMKNFCDELNNSLLQQSDNVDLEQLTERYINECFVDLLVDMMVPIMKERAVTEADLKTANAILSTPECQTFLAHQNEMNDRLNSIMQEYLPSFKSMEDVKKIPVNPDIDPEYAAKFKNMMEASGLEEKMLSFMDQFFPKQWLEDSDETKEIANIKKWINDNYTVVSLNSAYGVMTLEDLDYGAKLYSNESYRKIVDFSGVDFSTVMSSIGEITMKYLNWMESHGAQLSEKAKGLKYLFNMDWNDSNE
ncbi:MAG: hypothetical protein IJK93_04835 [Muribaculaceae bacterium]|nr:hypothetical protein [Muribaculaceae bacterium]